ncbi:MAG: HesA/MoeB/ThiF family protein [Tissierellales bacterium]|nr:HesA/MoeB/ThiF family protein [Tissierellales bacterium]
MDKRYSKNLNALSVEDVEKLNNSHVCVVGCGGLGGNILEYISRIGIEKITAVDGDIFDETNLNRQLLSTTENLGLWKVNEARRRLKLINPKVDFAGIKNKITEENIDNLLPKNVDCIIDAVDNIKTRFLLEEFAEKNKIPLIHGAIGGWYGQISVIMPGDKTISKIYQSKEDDEDSKKEPMGNLPHIASLIASLEVNELIKLLTGKGDLLRNEMLYIDLKSNSYNKFEL